MPKRLSPDLNLQLLSYIRRQPEGAGIETLLAQFGSSLSRRSIQRKLTKLLGEGQLKAVGQGRALRYRASKTGSTDVTLEVGESSLPVSPAGSELRDLVHRDRLAREPVGYKREFLDAYRPNETRYLPAEAVEHLNRIGRTPMVDQLAGTYARSILRRLLIDLSWASSALEGNTYSLLETERLLELNEVARGKADFETQMILNHRNAIEFLVQAATDGEVEVSGYTIRNVHALLADNLLRDPAAAGRLRSGAVGIGGSVYLPLQGGAVLEEAFDQLVATAAAIEEPFEQAFFLMVHLPYLQPFDDVNKRVSRIVVNLPFIRANLCPLSFIEVPQRPYIDGMLAVYELNRIELLRDVFLWAYERSTYRYLAVRQTLGDPDPFRLRNRNAMIAVVGSIVRQDHPLMPLEIRDMAAGFDVSDADMDHFVRLVQQELGALHEGNFSRYRLRPSEFFKWRQSK